MTFGSRGSQKRDVTINSSADLAAGTITFHDATHLGIAVDTEGGPRVPVIYDADDLNLHGMSRRIADLSARARANRISADELEGATFTITDHGRTGGLFDTPLISLPQSAALGLGSIVRRPCVISDAVLGETIAVRSMAHLALTYDHRIIDGAAAGRFLTTVRERLEDGSFV